MLTSWKDTVPWVGSSNRLMRRRRVDFPAPERPMTPTICPDAISRLTSLTATVVPKRLVRPCSLSIASPCVPRCIGALCQLCACCKEPQYGRYQAYLPAMIGAWLHGWRELHFTPSFPMMVLLIMPLIVIIRAERR